MSYKIGNTVVIDNNAALGSISGNSLNLANNANISGGGTASLYTSTTPGATAGIGSSTTLFYAVGGGGGGGGNTSRNNSPNVDFSRRSGGAGAPMGMFVADTSSLSSVDITIGAGGNGVSNNTLNPGGASTITITPNTSDKLYFVQNNSGHTATFTQGSGGNVAVEDGATKILYADGAGATAAVTDFTNSLSLNATTFKIDGTEVTSSAAELNILDGATLSTAELNKLDGVTATTAELNYVDTTAGTVAASKAVIADANRDVSNIRNLSVTGDITSGDLVLDNNVQNRVNNVDGTSGRWRIQEGQENLYIINEVNGKKYKFALEEVQ